MITTRRSAIQDIWNATRAGFARLNRALADAGDVNDMVFHVPQPRDLLRPEDCERARRSDESATVNHGKTQITHFKSHTNE
jgi:hypothetical protein